MTPIGLGIWIGVGSGSGGGGTAPVVPTNFQIVSTHNGIGSVKYPGTTSSRTDVQAQTRLGHYTGAAAVTRWRIGQGAYIAPQNNNAGDQALGNSFNYEAAIERVTGGAAFARLQYSGADTVNIADNTALSVSDEASLAIAADTEFWTREGMIIGAASQNFPQSVRGGQDSSRIVSTATASQIGATGTFTTPGGGITTPSITQWPLVLGVPAVPQMGVLVIGDSITEGQGDGSVPNGSANSGPIRRAFWNVDGHHIPFDFHAVSGRSFAGYTSTTSPNTRARWQYATHVIMALGRNSTSLGITGLKAAATSLFQELRAVTGPYGKRLHITAVCLIPSTSSTDSWATAANQTPGTGFEDGGTRDQYNAWIKAGADGLVDDNIDYASAVEDPNDHTKFVTNGAANYPTTDGTHPTAALCALMASGPVTDWVRRQVPIPAI